MLRSIIIAAVVIIIILIVLQLLGINVGSMLAGVGIASIIVGFALQDAMKDIFRGLEIVETCLGAITTTFADHKILLPYNQLDIHTKR